MEVSYKKDVRHNYMVIEKDVNCKMEGFCMRMLEQQQIHGILAVEQKRIDNRSLLYYDITAKQSIDTLLEKSTLSYQRVLKLCSGILRTIESAYEYFLSEDDFILSPGYIYIDISTDTPWLCLLPGYGKDIKEQMKDFLEYLMNKVDYKDKDAVYLVYQLYAVTKEESYTFGHMKELLYNAVNTVEITEQEPIAGNTNSKEGYSRHEVAEHSDIKGFQPREQTIKPADRGEKGYSGDDAAGSGNGSIFRKKRINPDMDKIPVVMEKIESDSEINVYPVRTYLYAGACILGGILILIIGITSGVIYNPFGKRIDYSKLVALIVILLCVEGYLLNKILDKKNKVTRMVRDYEYIDPRVDHVYRIEQNNQRTNSADIIGGFPSVKADAGCFSSVKADASCFSSVKADAGCISSVKTDVGCLPSVKEDTGCALPVKAYSRAGNNRIGKRRINTSIDFNQEDQKENSRANSHYTGINQEDKEYEPTCLLNAPVSEAGITPILKAFEEEKYKNILITSLPFFIGKLRTNVDYCLESDTVSRYHAKITKEGDTYYLTDLNSTNGTYVNQQLLQTYEKKELCFGDEVVFADIRYRFLQQ